MQSEILGNLKEEFDKDFQIGILSLMYKDLRFLAYASDNLSPKYFSDSDMGWMFNALRTHFKNARSVITKRSLIDRIKIGINDGKIDKSRVKFFQELYNFMREDDLTDAGYIESRVVIFVKKNLMKEAFIKAQASYQKGEYIDIPKIFIEASQRSDIQFKTGQTYPDVEKYDERISRRSVKRRIVPTGILELDSFLRGGGLGEKELGVVLAPTNRGKSMFLKQISEFNMMKGLKGIIFTLEMSEDRYLDRFDMSVASMTSVETQERPDAVKKRLVELMNDQAVGNVHIKEYPTKSVTVGNLRTYTDNLKRTGFFPDFIVVDYADLLKSEQNFSEERHNQSYIYKMLRGWAVDEQLPIWTASQANRASLSKSQVTVADISEDFGKAMIADVIIGLCQNKKEKEQQEMRLFLAKNRDGTSGTEVTISTNFAHGKFYDAL
tara:strand:+ start:1158 stop:2468 length:1311 start_codon:yes stop_codon:yes gene_type:complete